jgi:hypothetical protein
MQKPSQNYVRKVIVVSLGNDRSLEGHVRKLPEGSVIVGWILNFLHQTCGISYPPVK